MDRIYLVALRAPFALQPCLLDGKTFKSSPDGADVYYVRLLRNPRQTCLASVDNLFPALEKYPGVFVDCVE